MRERWLTIRAFKLHALLVVIVPLCLIAGWWQLHQALDGNSLSWAYTVEWPVFAVIAVVGWWQLLHEDAAERAARAADRRDRARAKRAAADPGRSWRAATLDAHDVGLPSAAGGVPGDGELSGPEAQRVAEAARREYAAHLARQAEADATSPWRPRASRN